MRVSLVAALAAALVAVPVQAGTFRVLLQNSGVAGLSHNGRIATGVYATGLNGAQSWRWTPETGVQPIPGFLDAMGMSAWAQPIAGAALDADGHQVAAIAYSNASVVGPVVVGPYPGGSDVDGYLSSAFGVSDDATAVGLAYDADGRAIAFSWTAADGMSRLPVNRPGTASRANGISRDGRLVFGWNDQTDGFRSGVIWRDGVPTDLTDALGGPIGEALAATRDGAVVVGGGYYTADGSEAWRWTAAGGAQPIGVLPNAMAHVAAAPAPVARSPRIDLASPFAVPILDGFLPAESFAFAVSDDGNVIVGASGVWPIRTASIWTPGTGLQPLADYVTARGVTVPENWTLAAATAVSADGETIGGWGIDADGIMAAFLIDLHADQAVDAIVEARGTIDHNDLASGPFAGIAAGTPVTLSFVLSHAGIEIAPGRATVYPIRLDTFELRAGTAVETLVASPEGPSVMLTNDYPLSDGIHLFATPTASGQTFEFELFNPGGDLFDSDDLDRIDRSFGPASFEKASWQIAAGNTSLRIQLEEVGIHDAAGDVIFGDGFEP